MVRGRGMGDQGGAREERATRGKREMSGTMKVRRGRSGVTRVAVVHVTAREGIGGPYRVRVGHGSEQGGGEGEPTNAVAGPWVEQSDGDASKQGVGYEGMAEQTAHTNRVRRLDMRFVSKGCRGLGG